MKIIKNLNKMKKQNKEDNKDKRLDKKLNTSDVSNYFDDEVEIRPICRTTTNETIFKILMHCGIYVDNNLLEKGIYATQKPNLYSKDDTIELISERGRMMKDMMGNHMISEIYFENLKQCQLIEVSLLINTNL